MSSYKYAEVIIDIAISQLDKPFSYLIPEKLQDRIDIGTRVLVPFGKGNSEKKGYVIGLTNSVNYDASKIKEILSVADTGISSEEKQIELAAFIRRNYGGTMSQALKIVLPVKAEVKRRVYKEVSCIVGREELIAAKGEAMRKHQNAKLRLIDALLEQTTIPNEWISSKLGVSSQTIASLEKAGLVKVNSYTEYRNPVHIKATSTVKKLLSEEQSYVSETIAKETVAGKTGKYLIHGITGSGKTEVYLSIIEEVVKSGKQVIYLIPEIALTYQTLVRVYERFGDRVSVLNSSLSAGERYDQYLRAHKGEIDIVIGPRSALFVPFSNLGLIIIDEEHESSYKSEQTPKYNTIGVAEKKAEMFGAGLVVGSATPSLETYYKVKTGEYRLFKLTKRLTGGTLPNVSIVDLREELRNGNKSIFSDKLKALMDERIRKGEQIILFLNRRGYAGFISCRACGEVIKCPHCDVSLSEHYGNKLSCHYCGYTISKPKKCPACGSGYIAGFKAGTEKIEELIKELYPEVKILRMDGDTTKTKDSYEKLLSAFANEEAQILIGTQMIVKGHDFPKVTLVGVLAADLSLNANDYHSGERTFQLLTQAVGRAGRGSLPGEAVIQTYRPEHYSVILSSQQNYEGFYEEEISYRDLMSYPPVAHMLAILVYGPKEAGAEALAKQISEGANQYVRNNKLAGEVAVLGSSKGSISKIKDMYRFVVYIKASSYEYLVEIKDSLEEYIRGLAPKSEYVQFDFDPVNLV